MTCVLLIEDDEKLRELLVSDFEMEGYAVLTASDGQTGLNAARRKKADVIVLDIMLPKMNGLELCRVLRHEGVRTPILLLTAKGQETEKVAGLDAGADDYLSKPFGSLELRARIKALLRRHDRITTLEEGATFGNIKVNFRSMMATPDGKRMAFTRKELGILQLLWNRRGQIVSREDFLREIWGYEEFPTTRTIDTQILALRQKLAGDDPRAREWIETVYGVGYRFIVED